MLRSSGRLRTTNQQSQALLQLKKYVNSEAYSEGLKILENGLPGEVETILREVGLIGYFNISRVQDIACEDFDISGNVDIPNTAAFYADLTEYYISELESDIPTPEPKPHPDPKFALPIEHVIGGAFGILVIAALVIILLVILDNLNTICL